MPNHFGCDASSTGPQVIPTVTARLRKPEWIGRYLCQIEGVSTGLTKQEVADTHALGVAELLIYNGATIGSVRGNYQDGLAMGHMAASLAANLLAPPGVAIIADIETNMFPTASWMAGYLDGAHAASYVGGFYGNANVQAFVAAYQQAHTLTAAPCYFWASEPELNNWFDTVRLDFTPLAVPGFERECVWHQFSESNLGGIVDLDVCTPEGFALCWPAVPVKHTTTVSVAGALKTTPDHASLPALDEKHQLIKSLPVGTEIRFAPDPHTGKEISDDKLWAHLYLVGRVVHGWYLRVNLVTV